MSRKSVHRAIVKDQARTERLAKITPQLSAAAQRQMATKTSKHRGQRIAA